MPASRSALVSGARASVPWLLLTGLLTSIALFSTTYSVGGVFLYPRVLLAFAGVFLALRSGRLARVAAPLWLLAIIVVFAMLGSLGAWQWSQLTSFLVPLLRGVLLPYFAVFALLAWFGAATPRDPEERLHRLTQVVCVAILIQATVAVAHLSLPAFRAAYLASVNLAETWREMADLGLPRFSGIGGLSIYDTAIAYCILGAVLLLSRPRTGADAWLRALTLAVIVLLCVLHGRSGLVFAVVLWVMLVVQEVRAKGRRPSVSLRGALVMFALCVLAVLFFDEDLRKFLLEFAGEIFINLAAGNGLRSDSTDEFLDSYLRLPDWEAIVGGSGQWAQPDIAEATGSSYATDSGYLLLMNFGGLPLLLVSMFVFWRLTSRYARAVGGQAPGKRTGGYGFVGFLVVVFGLMTWKGPLFLSEHCMTSLFLVLGLQGLRRETPRRAVPARVAGRPPAVAATTATTAAS